jgi:transposase
MRKLKEILRLRLQAQLSIRQIAASTQLRVGVVQKVVRQAQQSNLTWAKLAELNEYQITRLVYPTPAAPQRKGFIDPDWGEIYQELKRKGVTKQLLWQEYGEQHPNLAYSYSQFCAR